MVDTIVLDTGHSCPVCFALMDKIELAKWAYLAIGVGIGALWMYLVLAYREMSKRDE